MHRRLAPLLALLMVVYPLAKGWAQPVAHSTAPTLGPLTAVAVSVPASMRGAPFDVPRTLQVPRGFRIAVYARVPGARFMAITPDGNLLVSVPGAGKIVVVRASRAGTPLATDFVTGLNGPQGMAFHTIGKITYLYVGERSEVDRYPWRNGDLRAERRQVIIPNLPYGGTADGDAHPYKDLAFGPGNVLYVGFGSSCNACTNDATSQPVRGAIYRYNPDGTGGQLFARGLRNPEGLAVVPGTSTLWTAVNERDQIPYPFRDATGQYGKVVTSYVDNHPPDEFTAVRQGADYGWPYCDPDPQTRTGYINMPFDPNAQFNQSGGGYNPHGAIINCGSMTRIAQGIQAHSAPLGLTFLQGTAFPRQYQAAAVIALHGSWDRRQKTGYRVIYFPWVRDGGSGHPGPQQDLVAGWLDVAAQSAWDRPVDAVVDAHGDLLISADQSGSIYALTYRG
jgi:glucose/arabinose dehydrogenase